MPRKSRLAIALDRGSSYAARILGSRGGKARAKALSPARRRAIAQMGGRPRRYRLAPDGALERRDGDVWLLLSPPYDKAARAALRSLRHRS